MTTLNQKLLVKLKGANNSLQHLSNSKVLISFILFLTLVSSCRRSDDLPFTENKTTQTREFSIVNGIIAFDTRKSFDDFTSKMYNTNIEDFEDQFSNLTGFNSLITPAIKMSQNQFQLTENDDDEPWDPAEEAEFEDSLVLDPYFAAMLNRNREIEIENTIFRITEKGVYAYKPGLSLRFDELYANAAYFDELIRPYAMTYEYYEDGIINPKTFDIPEIEQDIYLVLGGGSIRPYDQVCTDCNQQNTEGTIQLCPIGSKNFWGWEKDCDFHYYDSKRRVRGTYWSQSHIFFSSIGLKTRNQRRRFGIWWNINKNQISVKGKGKYELKVQGNPFPIINTYDVPEKFDNKKAVYRFDFESGAVLTCAPTTSISGQHTNTTEAGGSPCKIKIYKAAQLFKLKEHKSDHAVYFDSGDKNLGIIFKL